MKNIELIGLKEKVLFFYDCAVLLFSCLFYYASYIFKECLSHTSSVQSSQRLQCVLITGAARGLGRALAQSFAKRGSSLILCDIDSNGLEETRRLLNDEGYRDVYCFQVDLSNKGSIDRFITGVQKMLTENGQLSFVSCVVNNAVTPVTVNSVVSSCTEDLRYNFEVNVLSHSVLYKHFLPQMYEHNCGHVVTISSVMYDYNLPYMSAYCMTKCAATQLHTCLRLELKDYVKQSSNQNKLDLTNVKTTIAFPYLLDTSLFEGMTTRAHFIFPAISHIDAAEQIVSAVENEEEEVFIPRYFALFRLSRLILPSHLYDQFILKVLGVGERARNMRQRRIKQ